MKNRIPQKITKKSFYPCSDKKSIVHLHHQTERKDAGVVDRAALEMR